MNNILSHFIQKSHMPIKIIMFISFTYHFGWNCFPWCFGMIICFLVGLLVFIISFVFAAQVAINTKNGLFAHKLVIRPLAGYSPTCGLFAHLRVIRPLAGCSPTKNGLFAHWLCNDWSQTKFRISAKFCNHILQCQKLTKKRNFDFFARAIFEKLQN